MGRSGGCSWLRVFVALIAQTERQAVQLALLTVLASIFFGGLAVDLTELSPAVRTLAQLVPVTQATAMLQDLSCADGRARPGVGSPSA